MSEKAGGEGVAPHKEVPPMKIRHDTFERTTGKPITIIEEAGKKQVIFERGIDRVDPSNLGRTQDRRTGH